MENHEEIHDRVHQNTSEKFNSEIADRTEMTIHYYSRFPGRIDERLGELDKEWDIERVLETNAASFALLGIGLGLFKKKWLLLSAAVAGFLLNHGIQGWCPPLPLFRKFGVRTKSEILLEKYALKAIRGDFDNMSELQNKPSHEKAEIVLQMLKKDTEK